MSDDLSADSSVTREEFQRAVDEIGHSSRISTKPVTGR
jgi:hypothetical protein